MLTHYRRCECPEESLDHEEGKCLGHATKIYKNIKTQKEYALCPDCVLSKYVFVRDLEEI